MLCAPMIVLSLVALVPQDKAEAAKLKTAHVQAELCTKATMEKNYGKLADLTHPKIVEAAGGKDKMVAQIEKTMTEMEAQGFKFEQVEVNVAKSITKNDTTLYCVLPTKTKVTFKGSKITSQAYLIGVSTDDGKSWKFIDGAAGEESLRKLIPEIPKSLKLPAKQDPTVEK